MSETSPLPLISSWLEDAVQLDLTIPHAAVLSTVGLDGYPNARSVAVKEITADGIVVTGSRASRKGRELAVAPQCALTMWWDGMGRQIRLQGDAQDLEPEQAQRYFADRSREARVVSVVSEQGAPRQPGELEVAYQELIATDERPAMPQSWGGGTVVPIRVEFMEFSEARFHSRVLFTRHGPHQWKKVELQP